MTTLQINVIGTPAPQGSKRGFAVKNKNTGKYRAVVVDDNKPTLKNWRQDVRAAALDRIYETGWTKLDGPVIVLITFYMPRPRGHYGTGRNAATIKDSSPAYPATKPDLDKLERSVLDALGEAGAWTDDSRVVVLGGTKLYADHRQPGAEIQVTAALPQNPMPALATTPSNVGAGMASDPVAAPTALVTSGTAGAATVQEALL